MTDNRQKQIQDRLVFLDGLRGLCALIVILEHVGDNPISDMFPTRQFGMCFFFLLSGFVMSHAYGNKLGKDLSAWTFTKIRFVRLYPIYISGFLLGLALAVYSLAKGWDPSSWSGVAIAAGFGAMMLPAPPVYGVALFPFNRPAWSLGFEMLATILYGIFARYLTTRVLVGIVALSSIGVIGTAFYPDHAWEWAGFWYGLWMVIYGFFGGVLIHRLYMAGKLIRVPAWVAVAFVFASIAVPTNDATHGLYSAFGATVLMPVLLMISANAPVSGVMARVCSVLGTLSYGIYVVHVPLWEGMKLAIAKFDLEYMPSWIAPIAVALVSAVVAALLNKFFDPPLRALLKRWLLKRKPEQPKKPRAAAASAGAGVVLDNAETGNQLLVSGGSSHL